MIQLISEVEIPASPRRVWEALIDFPDYPKWNPDVAIRGVAGSGNEIEWSFGRAPGGRRMWATALIIECEEPRVIAWTLGIRGLFTVEQRFSLRGTPHGSRLRHEAVCRGFISKVFGGRIRRSLGLRLSAINAGLHQYSSRFGGASTLAVGTGKTKEAKRRSGRQAGRRAR